MNYQWEQIQLLFLVPEKGGAHPRLSTMSNNDERNPINKKYT